MFYLIVPLFVFLCRRFSPLKVLLVTYLASSAYVMLMQYLAASRGSAVYLQLGRQLPGQLTYFMAGAFFYYFLPFFERWRIHFVAAAAIVLAANSAYPMPILEPFALATLVAFFGMFLYVGNFGKYGDFSYSVYILHVPIIQLLLISGAFDGRPWSLVGAGVLITAGGAVAMWHLVEKRFLFRSSHYIAALSEDAGEAAKIR